MSNQSKLAKEAYKMADAMIAERERNHE